MKLLRHVHPPIVPVKRIGITANPNYLNFSCSIVFQNFTFMQFLCFSELKKETFHGNYFSLFIYITFHSLMLVLVNNCLFCPHLPQRRIGESPHDFLVRRGEEKQVTINRSLVCEHNKCINS